MSMASMASSSRASYDERPGDGFNQIKKESAMRASKSAYDSSAPVVRRLDNAIHWINRYPADKFNKTNHAIRWIVIYPVDSVIHLLNSRGLVL